MYKKIAVTLDGSPLAEKALPYAVKLANLLNTELLLLRIADLPPLVSDNVDHELEAIESAEAYLKSVEKVISDSTKPLFIPAERLQPLVAYGKPEFEISEIVPFEEADLLIMTTHGRKGLARLTQGSISSKVLHQISIPVILIKPENLKEEIPLENLMSSLTSFDASEVNILMTVDGSPESESIVAPTVEFAKKVGASIYLFTVVLPPMPVEMGSVSTGYGFGDEAEKLLEQANEYIKKLEAKIAEQGVKVVSKVSLADPAAEIVQYAQEIQATMISMSTHARGKLGQLVMGSVADEVMRESHLPVMLKHMPSNKETNAENSFAGATN
jgi:nucleotide-binding universal stress UspA family protein